MRRISDIEKGPEEALTPAEQKEAVSLPRGRFQRPPLTLTELEKTRKCIGRYSCHLVTFLVVFLVICVIVFVVTGLPVLVVAEVAGNSNNNGTSN